MCGRFTVKASWAELVALYRLTMNASPHNLRPRYNVCPTDPVDVVTAERQLVTMRWGLVPWSWSKPLKELRIATFNARAETVGNQASLPRCVQTHALSHPDVRLLRVAEHPERKAAVVFHGALIAPNKYVMRSSLFVVVYLLASFARVVCSAPARCSRGAASA